MCWSRRLRSRSDFPRAGRSKPAMIPGPGRHDIRAEAAAPRRCAVRVGTAFRKGGAVNNDELQRELAKLRADYAAQLPATVAQMEELWRRLVAAEIAPSRLPELVRMAHSIAGSGATFGVPGAGKAAGALEAFLDRYGKSGQLPDAQAQPTVAALLAALRRAA